MSPKSEQANDSSAPAKTLLVLLVISDFLVRQYLADELREHGCEVVEAMNGEDAILLLQSVRPDVALADHELSGAMTGLDFIAWLQRNMRVKSLLTAGSFVPQFTKVIAPGAFVSKPFTAKDLCDRISALAATPLKPTASLYHLIYVSDALPKLTDQDAQDILEVSRQRNSHLGITGMLLFADQRFMQILEGSMTAVERVFASIARDKRHIDVKVLSRNSIKTRSFGAWTMGFDKMETSRLDVLQDAFRLDETAMQKTLAHIADGARSLFATFLAKAPL
ncbi:MAG: BLUF domain-containing protein [Rhodospirillaceae bacterium]